MKRKRGKKHLYYKKLPKLPVVLGAKQIPLPLPTEVKPLIGRGGVFVPLKSPPVPDTPKSPPCPAIPLVELLIGVMFVPKGVVVWGFIPLGGRTPGFGSIPVVVRNNPVLGETNPVPIPRLFGVDIP